MPKFKVGDIIQHTTKEEPEEPHLYLVIKVTKKEYELTSTIEPFNSYIIDNVIDTWDTVKLV